jgi:hypothetical protein
MQRSFNQIALTAVLLLTLGVTTSFAANGNDQATISFHKEFKHAEVLSTDDGKDYTKITFKMNGAILNAFYNEKGELLAITHNIRCTELPLTLLMQIKQYYTNYWITDCFEIDTNGTTNYYITVENSDTKLTLRSNESDWETYSRITKI